MRAAVVIAIITCFAGVLSAEQINLTEDENNAKKYFAKHKSFAVGINPIPDNGILLRYEYDTDCSFDLNITIPSKILWDFRIAGMTCKALDMDAYSIGLGENRLFMSAGPFGWLRQYPLHDDWLTKGIYFGFGFTIGIEYLLFDPRAGLYAEIGPGILFSFKSILSPDIKVLFPANLSIRYYF